MQVKIIAFRDEAQCQQLESFLVDRIYEFDAKATGYFDGKLLAGSIENESGEIIAGFRPRSGPGLRRCRPQPHHFSFQRRDLEVLLGQHTLNLRRWQE